jgi:hypothetical protein
MEEKKDRDERLMHALEINIEIEELERREAPDGYVPINPGIPQ